MRYLALLLVGLSWLSPSPAVAADVSDVPGSAEWYLHVDFERMRREPAGKALYEWFRDEALDGVREDADIDLDKELDSLTAFSSAGQGPILIVEGDISEASKDKLMAVIAAEGNLSPQKSSGRRYYRLGDEKDSAVSFENGDINVTFDTLKDGAWLSFDVEDKILVTASEEQMQGLLAKKGKVPNGGGKGALLLLTAEKTLLQAGMNSGVIADGSNWNSNILRNTEQIAFLIAAAADKLALQARLTTIEPEMAVSLASVVRGLIGLAALSGDMDPEVANMLQGTNVEAKGNNLNISLAVDSDLVVRTISE